MSRCRAVEKYIYPHLDLGELEACLERATASCKRAIVVTDGVFSMRGDHAPLADIMEIAHRFDDAFTENVVVVVDDSHGVGTLGPTGRGTEEICGTPRVDLLIATLGKAVGVNGGYIVGSRTILDYLRETSPFYIYSNPITPGEAAAALVALDLIDSPRGRELLEHLRAMSARFREGLIKLGFETLPGDHPIVPLMVRDSTRTTELVSGLFARGIIATAISHPVVPRGEDEIRFQVAADHTPADIDEVLDILSALQR